MRLRGWKTKRENKMESPPSLLSERRGKSGNAVKHANECNVMQERMTRAKDEGKTVIAGPEKG